MCCCFNARQPAKEVTKFASRTWASTTKGSCTRTQNMGLALPLGNYKKPKRTCLVQYAPYATSTADQGGN